MNKGIVAMVLVVVLLLFGYIITAAKGEANAYSQTTCPVMGVKIDKNVHVYSEGKRVYLCCKDCKEKFKTDPKAYIKELESEGVVLETPDL